MRHRLIRSVIAAVVAAALFAPSAVARPEGYTFGPPPPASERGQSAVETVRAPGPTVVVEADESTGFDWGAAGIGAGAAVLIVLVAGAAASTTLHHRRAAVR